LLTSKADLRLAEVRADKTEIATAAEGARTNALRDRLTTMQEQLPAAALVLTRPARCGALAVAVAPLPRTHDD
jgi:hypothetical protein